MSVERLLEKLDGVRSTGPDRWLARCPAHDDGRASLSVRELEDGRVLVHDFAGCSVEEVLAAAGLTFNDLFPEKTVADSVRGERRPHSLRHLAAGLEQELTLALIVLGDVGAGRPVDADRAAVARSRIAKFLGELRNAA